MEEKLPKALFEKQLKISSEIKENSEIKKNKDNIVNHAIVEEIKDNIGNSC
jgi:hypothetical protein